MKIVFNGEKAKNGSTSLEGGCPCPCYCWCGSHGHEWELDYSGIYDFDHYVRP